ncbi:glycosyltransferase family 2 protein [Alkalimarinus sediminis]|uniref:Glycosyltransferase family 2 protein n=1 Tax=Alkalimarinus sediminis TaxID=1632866 RepID=A0A9E8HGZ0_9ALTE|nr:glycosyltransferase family 2 protein [Alkalimarinus sediminis]UZW74065.1 glycosyltransferase family 2 protein [Alkalimarinus sediminis]
MKAKISVVLATYNGALYLNEQLESVVNQTVVPFEIIVSDDGSTDKTKEIVESFVSKYSFIYWHDNTCHGVNENFENGLRHATGDYIAFCDQDDIWSLNKLETLLDKIGSNSLIYSRSELIDQHGDMIARPIEDVFSISRFTAELSPLYFLNFNCISGHAMMFNRELADKVVPFSSYVMYDQWIAMIAACTDSISYVDEALVMHRIHDSNTHNNFSLRNIKANAASKSSRYLSSQQRLSNLIDDLLDREVLVQEQYLAVLTEYKKKLLRTEFNFLNISLFQLLKTNSNWFFANQNNVRKRLFKLIRGNKYYRFVDLLKGRGVK